ncbi:Speckle-type POZ protein [Araneus ventricosus]|uniref:Speckle-type POZ protein n=1 Tax=Araneus ventricosus TaxID=182803 RepID=A0A4Y2U6L0_ARAVE|nr:Speckle-type POZ protein [Araneus ventricosus]
MTTPASFSEEECLNVYWKIKNFSFCREKIESPEYSISGNRYWLSLCIGSDYVDCELRTSTSNWPINLNREISFLTCDCSPEESISGGNYVYLRVPKDAIFGKRRNSFLPEDTLTVRFRSPTGSERGKVVICSQIGVERKYFLWKYLSNYQYCLEKSVQDSQCYGDIKLTLKSTGGFNTDEQLFIEISRKGGERCYYILKVSVLDVDGKSHNEVSDEFVLEKTDGVQTKVFPAFFKKSKLLACKNLLLPNDTLSLKCNFAISLGSLADQTSVVSYCEDVESLVKVSDDLSMTVKEKTDCCSAAELQTDLKSILKDGTLFDETLQIGTEVIKVHKTILSARSPVFRAMFTKDMKEAINSTVVIEDLDLETVRRLLLYMYTDTIRDYQWENVKKLYFAADKYEILSLKRRCVSFLKTNLSVSNVSEILVLADLHQDGELKSAALDFISEYDSAVFTSEEWQELEKNNSSLAVQIPAAASKLVVPLQSDQIFRIWNYDTPIPEKIPNATIPEKIPNATIPEKIPNATIPEKIPNATIPEKIPNTPTPEKIPEMI